MQQKYKNIIAADKKTTVWKQFQIDACSDDIKEKASIMLVCALGDSAIRGCSSKFDSALRNFKGWTITFNPVVSPPEFLYWPQCIPSDSKTIRKYGDVYRWIQKPSSHRLSVRMGTGTKIKEFPNSLVLLASTVQEMKSPLKSTVAT